MPTPYEPVIRHEVPPFLRACQPCVFQSINEPCGLIECNCTCNLQASAPVALDDVDPPQLREPVPEEPLPGWDEPVITYDNGVAWVEPPGKPEDIESWVPGPITIPSPDEWIVFPTPEKSDNITLLRLAVVALAADVAALTFLTTVDWLGKTILIVLSAVAVVLALLSTQ
jgi:hypothetical protein